MLLLHRAELLELARLFSQTLDVEPLIAKRQCSIFADFRERINDVRQFVGWNVADRILRSVT